MLRIKDLGASTRGQLGSLAFCRAFSVTPGQMQALQLQRELRWGKVLLSFLMSTVKKRVAAGATA